jgi:hypothetical protein
MRMSRFSCASTRNVVAKGVPQRSAWLQGETHGVDAFEADAMCQILISLAAIREIRQFGGDQREFLGKLHRLRADFLADLAEGRLDRHAGFHADQ